jgi:hypothetical protein
MALGEIGRALFGGPKDPKVEVPRSLVPPRNVFEYPRREIAQGVVALATGLLVVGLGMLDGEGLWPPGRIIAGLSLAALGTWKARGVRRITIANGMLTGEFPGGRRQTWPLAELYAEGRQLLVVVRERSSGRIAFVVRPGTPDQKALADFLGGKDGPRKGTPA